jgi:hypothetical protein
MLQRSKLVTVATRFIDRFLTVLKTNRFLVFQSPFTRCTDMWPMYPCVSDRLRGSVSYKIHRSLVSVVMASVRTGSSEFGYYSYNALNLDSF